MVTNLQTFMLTELKLKLILDSRLKKTLVFTFNRDISVMSAKLVGRAADVLRLLSTCVVNSVRIICCMCMTCCIGQ